MQSKINIAHCPGGGKRCVESVLGNTSVFVCLKAQPTFLFNLKNNKFLSNLLVLDNFSHAPHPSYSHLLPLGEGRKNLFPRPFGCATHVGTCASVRETLKIYGRGYSFNLRKESNRKPAFTLAEVLITLGIIGIVAALTLPNLIANHREKETVVRLKKAYSTMSQAYTMILNDYGEPSDWSLPSLENDSWDDVAILFSKYIKNVRVCTPDENNSGKCFQKDARKDLLNNNVDEIGSRASLISLDGMVYGIAHQISASSAKDNMCGNNYCFNIDVDINGNKGPNRWGVDTFVFQVGRNRIIPRGGLGAHHTHNNNCCDTNAKTIEAGWWNGSGCSAWVLQEENLDYLKCVKGNQKYCSQKYTFN